MATWVKRSLLSLAVTFLLPGGAGAQAGEPGLVDRLGARLYYGWPRDLTTAFAENQICPSGEAREFGLALSYSLTSFLGIELGGSRFRAKDHDMCVDGLIFPPEEGPYTYSYTSPTDATMGYPFYTIWSHLSFSRELVEGIFGRAFGGFGYFPGKKTRLWSSGVSAEAGTGRLRIFLEYQVLWYGVQREAVDLHFMDQILVDEERTVFRDPHRSGSIHLGLRFSPGGGGGG